MLLIADLEEYAESVKARVPAIKKTVTLSDEAQLAKVLTDHKASDNILLVALYADHDKDRDNLYEWNNITSFLVLEKIDYSTGLPAMGESFKRTQAAAAAIVKLMLEDYEEHSCGLMGKLIIESLNIGPRRALTQCQGYEITFNLITEL
ncbi:hypothetical protein ACLI1A_10095 [Flavobacterium sp. RHBU_3]|uniref:hypothetical protein n=1 Tax=Flavobacterium sp. RHBU_3 TaxID=3391184 RepID=UPI003984B128